MNETTTPRKAPKWLKITVGVLIPIAILLAFVGDDKTTEKTLPPIAQKSEMSAVDQELGAIVRAVKADTLFHVKAAMVKAGMLCVAVTDLDKGMEGGNAYYFLDAYNLNQNRLISKCLIYKWKKGDSPDSIFEKREAAGSMLTIWRRKEISDNWAAKYLSTDGSCKPVTEYLIKNLNDLDSYEHVETEYTYQPGNDCVLVNCKFRAKNGFGALMLHGAQAKVSLDGVVEYFKEVD